MLRLRNRKSAEPPVIRTLVSVKMFAQADLPDIWRGCVVVAKTVYVFGNGEQSVSLLAENH